MSDTLLLEFAGGTAEQYRAVNELLGIDASTGTGDWPAGLLSHSGSEGDGALVVVEVWDSKAAQEDFMHSRLGPALGQVGVPEPSRVAWLSTLGTYAG